eukprot:jgi/Botrbrau1/11241/Bobra.0038s0013.1
MNILSTFINSGEKRPRSESPTPDDPLETTVLTALQKFLPSLVAQMSEKAVDTLKATIEVTVAAAVEPLKTEIGQLASRQSTRLIKKPRTSVASSTSPWMMTLPHSRRPRVCVANPKSTHCGGRAGSLFGEETNCSK